MWQLIINGPGYFDTAYDLPEGGTSLGRAEENDIVLSGDLVSRRHAHLQVSGDELTVEDLQSRNGSRVNGTPIQGVVALKSGDTVSIGDNALTIRRPAEAEMAKTEMVGQMDQSVRRVAKDEVDIESAVILSKDVRDSVIRRILDNVQPFDPIPSPFDPPAPPEQALTRQPQIEFDSLLLLYRAAARLSTAASLSAFLDRTVDELMEQVGATTAVVLLRHTSGQLLPAAVRHRGKLEKGEVPVSDAIVETAMARGTAMAVASVRDDARFSSRESVILYGIDQVFCVPIGQQEPFSGVLYLNRSAKAEGDVESLLDLTTAVSHLIATAVEKWTLKMRSPTEERLRSALQRFHAPSIVERQLSELGKEGSDKLLRVEERTVTVLFADLAGFTQLVSQLPPERTVDLLNEFYGRMTSIIFSFEGTVDKFMGDAVMAIFGAPYGRADDALRAVRTALALKMEWNKAMSRRPPEERCLLRVGINTGKALTGIVGAEARLDYTAIGETVNVASWTSATASPGQVLVTGATLASIGARFETAPLGQRALAGNRARVALFEVVEEDVDLSTNPGRNP